MTADVVQFRVIEHQSPTAYESLCVARRDLLHAWLEWLRTEPSHDDVESERVATVNAVNSLTVIETEHA
jgi:hypothetical protein